MLFGKTVFQKNWGSKNDKIEWLTLIECNNVSNICSQSDSFESWQYIGLLPDEADVESFLKSKGVELTSCNNGRGYAIGTFKGAFGEKTYEFEWTPVPILVEEGK